MILNEKLNKKQLIVGWTMISLVLIVAIRTFFASRRNLDLSIKISLYLYFFILVFGVLVISALRDKKR